MYDSTLKKEVKLLNTVILKIRQEEVTVAYPFQYMYVSTKYTVLAIFSRNRLDYCRQNQIYLLICMFHGLDSFRL